MAGGGVSLACQSAQEEVVKMEWRCRGCFSISKTKESRSGAGHLYIIWLDLIQWKMVGFFN